MKKDPEKVAAAYKGLLAKVKVKPRYKLAPEDYKKFMRDAGIFLIPALIVFLTALQQGVPVKDALMAVYTWALGMGINLLQKWASEKTYVG